ncbi:xanthine dehydrogenase family protein molybdopterin-binding subunit [Salinibaculum salinum]|uniref:xanthine dehydrogenase family protein molybdopterin-binding subunit n=1 Tax=Salinibaculum salinum TaxID=3131996 RepID=UPI0030EDD256
MSNREHSDGGWSVGQSAPRKDARRKVRGTARYGTDIEREDMLHAGVVRSQQSHARVESVETERAAAVDGVSAVVTRADLPEGYGDRVRHYGDVIAAVAAESREAVDTALSAIEYDLDSLESVHDPREAVREDAPLVQAHPEFSHAHRHPRFTEGTGYVQNVDDYHSADFGDAEAGLVEADHVHEATYRTPRTNHCNLDCHCCLAEWEDDTLRVTATMGNRGHAEKTLERLFPDCEVEIERPPTAGSSFGGRSLVKLTLEPVAAVLARETGRPVRLAFDREVDFTAGDSRHLTVIDVTAGATADGDLTTLVVDVAADTGPYPNGVGHIVLSSCQNRPVELYDVENYRFEGVSAFTNNTPAGEYRGIGVTQVTWALESHLDELARQAGFEPVEFRRSNWVEEGEDHPVSGGPVANPGLHECLTRGKETFADIRSEPNGGDSGVVYGYGVAAGGQISTPANDKNTDYSEAKLVLDADGSLVARTGAIDIGQGAETTLAQIAAAQTGIDFDHVNVEGYDPAADIEDKYGSIANRTTYLIGSAVQRAAEDLTSELRSRAAFHLDAAARDLTIAGDRIEAPDGDAVALETLVEDPIAATGRVETNTAVTGYGVHFAEVAVDTETGKTDVTVYVAAQDVGYAINPTMVEGQLEGAIQHGIEFATLSELQLSEGIPENANLADYPVSSPAEMPDRLACEIVETNEQSGPFGAKGVGTPSIPPVAPAITNAIRDAVGVRFTTAPVRDEDVFLALQEGEQ